MSKMEYKDLEECNDYLIENIGSLLGNLAVSISQLGRDSENIDFASDE